MHYSALYSPHTLINYPAVQLSLSRISLNHVAPTVTKSGCSFHFFFFFSHGKAPCCLEESYLVCHLKQANAPFTADNNGSVVRLLFTALLIGLYRGTPGRGEKYALLQIDLPLEKVEKYQA